MTTSVTAARLLAVTDIVYSRRGISGGKICVRQKYLKLEQIPELVQAQAAKGSQLECQYQMQIGTHARTE